MSQPAVTPYERVYGDMELAPNGECWLFTGARNENGYGRIVVRAREKQYTHRISFEYANGPIPDGLKVCHKCDTPACVRPTHLFLGTQADNIRDMDRKGRANRRTRETHCKRGHEFTPENTRWHPEGYQRCRECENGPRRMGKRKPQSYKPRRKR